MTRVARYFCKVGFSALLLLASSADARAQNLAASVETSGATKIYLRVANLLPITSKPLIIARGSESILSGVKPGFFMPYKEIQKEGGDTFIVSSAGQKVGDFKVVSHSTASFFTAVALVSGKGPTVICLRDDPPPTKNANIHTPPTPRKRFRGYFGGFDFPYRVTVENVGDWLVHKEGQVVDVPIERSPPDFVSVGYLSRDGDPIMLHFPIDYTSADLSSAFVSQRGLKRPRLRCFPDNTLPIEENVAAAYGN